MKLKKVILILLFPFITEVMISCCNCLDSAEYRYINKEINVSNLDNSGKESVEVSSGNVLKNAYAIRLKILNEKVAYQRPLPHLFISSSYAYDCRCGSAITYVPVSTVTSLKIITLRDFDDSHLANSDISAYFKGFKGDRYANIPEFITTNYPGYYETLEPFIKWDLMLFQTSNKSTTHQFRIELTFTDGRKLTKDLTEINLI